MYKHSIITVTSNRSNATVNIKTDLYSDSDESMANVTKLTIHTYPCDGIVNVDGVEYRAYAAKYSADSPNSPNITVYYSDLSDNKEAKLKSVTFYTAFASTIDGAGVRDIVTPIIT